MSLNMTACACNWPLNMNVMLRKLFLVETAAIFHEISDFEKRDHI